MQTASFEKIISGETSLLEWITQNRKDGVLQDFLPDDDSIATLFPQLKDMNFVDGMLDGIMGASDSNEAQILFDLFCEFADANLDDALVDEYLGRIYLFSTTYRTLGYIDDFLELFLKCEAKNKDKIQPIAFITAGQFLHKATHREPVKLALAILGVSYLNDEELSLYSLFGLADEFANYVAVALKRNERNDIICQLIKKVKGWGRIQYLNFLEIKDEQTREWLLFEGYKCDINDNYTAPLCMQKGDLLGFIKERGFDDALYDATAAMFDALMGSGSGPHKITEYEDYDETFSLFFAHSKGVQMNAQRFRILLSLNTHLEIYSEDDENDEESAENEERDFAKKYAEQFLALVREIAFERDIDWQGLVLSDIFDYNHRKIAAKLGIDIWREFYTHALKNKDFDEWYELSKTRDIHRYKELCELVKSRFDLEAMKTEPKDELGMHSKFNAYRDLEMVVQGLRDFDEIFGVELVETLLQSPVTRSRNMALNTIESWEKNFHLIPQSLLKIIIKNAPKEPNESIFKRYKVLLDKYQND